MWTDKERKLHAQHLEDMRKQYHRLDADSKVKSNAKAVFGRPAFSKGFAALKKEEKLDE